MYSPIVLILSIKVGHSSPPHKLASHITLHISVFGDKLETVVFSKGHNRSQSQPLVPFFIFFLGMHRIKSTLATDENKVRIRQFMVIVIRHRYSRRRHTDGLVVVADGSCRGRPNNCCRRSNTIGHVSLRRFPWRHHSSHLPCLPGRWKQRPASGILISDLGACEGGASITRCRQQAVGMHPESGGL